jgi:Uma2 family endonuclease
MTLLEAPLAPPIPSWEVLPDKMSETEFVDWCTEDTWAEWIDGEVVVMNAVALDHAELFSFIHHLLRGFADAHDLGKILSEPFQIRLPKQRRRRSPDIFFVSNSRLHLLERNQCKGAPDLVVEIVSPDSQSRDRREKYLEYQSAGVLEYWLVDPASRTFEAYFRGSNGKYKPLPMIDGEVNSQVLKGFFFRQKWVWLLRHPRVDPLLNEMSRNRKKLASSRKA